MAQQDTSKLKEKILYLIRVKGPCLPVHISKETGLSMLFSGAFLSELVSDKSIKISNMRVGSSPVYYIPGQEASLENFAKHLNSKEKEAFNLLKEKKFLQDTKQEPAIRVALRSIRDFAMPFKKDSEIFWRFFKTSLSEFKIEKSKKLVQPPPIRKQIRKQKEPEDKPEIKQKELGIFDSQKKETKKAPKKKPTQKTNDKFFDKVKEFLRKQAIEISSIEGFSKTDLTLKIKDAMGEKLLVAYNKKRISELDILNAHKKASEKNLPYVILSLGETSKKLTSFIEAIKDLSGIEKI